MTGRGRGFCVLKMPQGPSTLAVDIAGQPGRPVGGTPASWARVARLRNDARRIEVILAAIRNRIAAIEPRRTPTGSGV